MQTKKNAANSFEKDFFKMTNKVFKAKTIENLRKRVNARLVNNAKGYIRYISKQVLFHRR